MESLTTRARRVLGIVLLVAGTVCAGSTEQGEGLVQDNCMQCHHEDDARYPDHNLGWVFGKRYEKAGWLDNVERMEVIALRDEYISEAWTDADKNAMADYLTEQTQVRFTDQERLGMIHFAVVHFPIGLSMVLALMELVGLVAGWPMVRDLRHVLAWLAALSAVAAVALGLVLIWPMAALSHDLTDHRNAGFASTAALLLAAVMREVSVANRRSWSRGLYLVLVVFSAVAAGIAGHLGGKLVHGEYLPTWIFG